LEGNAPPEVIRSPGWTPGSAAATDATAGPAIDAVIDDAPEAGPRLPVPLRPMTMADILDGAVEILKLAPRTVIALTAVLVLPVQLATVAVANSGVQNPTVIGVLGSPIFVGQVGSDRSNVAVVLFVLSSAMLPILTAAIAWLAGSWYGGASPGLAEVGRATVGRIPALLLAWLLVHLAEAVAAGVTFFLLGLGGVAVMVIFLLTAPAIAVEGVGPLAGMRRAARLARRGFFTLLLIAVLSAIVENVVFFAFVALSRLTAGYSWGWIVTSVLVTLGTLVSKPILAGATALAYIDVRVRAEGLDLELAASGLAASPR
jgi:hypothetical protein